MISTGGGMAGTGLRRRNQWWIEDAKRNQVLGFVKPAGTPASMLRPEVMS